MPRTFADVVVYVAFECPALMDEIRRLTGDKLDITPRTGIEALVDKATGFNPFEAASDEWRRFVAFVWRYVWCALPDEAFATEAR